MRLHKMADLVDQCVSRSGFAHLVWDWNGTLFNDFELNCLCLSKALASYRPAVTPHDYHTLFTHPIRDFYDALVGRQLSDQEWVEAQAVFHAAYLRSVHTVQLAPGALEAIAQWEHAGHSQSVLSMWSHEPLNAAVRRCGVDKWCTFIEGRTDPSIEHKAALMQAHMKRTDHARAELVVVVGDSLDDAVAAEHVGATPVLHSGGLAGKSALRSSGYRVVDSIQQAVEVALGLVAER